MQGRLGIFSGWAVQELNDKRLTLIEGSALSERDLLRAKAENATACLLLADRFSPKPHEEDLNLQFQARKPLHVIAKPSQGELGPGFDSRACCPPRATAFFPPDTCHICVCLC